MKKIYKLTPALFANVWGGNKLRAYGKDSAEDRIGESWELSFVTGSEATADGVKTSELFPREAWGKRAAKFEFFPTLTKFIDAREKLSVQVHPSDEYALANEGQYGKSEIVYLTLPGTPMLCRGISYYIVSRPSAAEAIGKWVLDGEGDALIDPRNIAFPSDDRAATEAYRTPSSYRVYTDAELRGLARENKTNIR